MPRLENDSPMEQITLQNDVAGADITFTGRLCAEHQFYDSETGALTQQRVYVTSDGQQAYSVIASDGRCKEKRAYLIRREGKLCKINNGLFDVTVFAEDLLQVVKGLCGVNDENSLQAAEGEDMSLQDFFQQVQEPNKAVNE